MSDLEKYISTMIKIRKALHGCPEIAFQEEKTKYMIKQHLESQTNLEVVDCGQWMYAKRTGAADGKKIAFRADFDAVTGGDGQPGHYCGHDGHAAVLCGLAQYLNEHRVSDTIYLIFQPAEEIGEGAKICCHLLQEEGIQEIYGFHNIPGYPGGALLLKEGTFACASTGLELKFLGTPSHAAYPEDGKNPSGIIAELITWMNQNMKQGKGLLLGTVIGIEAGSDAYGVSASEGTLRLTIRGEKQEEFESFVRVLRQKAEELSQQQGITVQMQEIERFPATQNHSVQVLELERKAIIHGMQVIRLEKPFRWSEDFGYYLTKAKGCMFGIGNGEAHPQLHTAEYEFPDEILGNGLKAFLAVISDADDQR